MAGKKRSTKKKTTKKKTAKKKIAKKKEQADRKVGEAQRTVAFDANMIKQGNTKLYTFKAKASVLYEMLSINRRIEDKDEGYQRTLSISRVDAISKHIRSGKTIPLSIVISFDNAKYSNQSSHLTVPRGTDVGWVIDGQHRLAGAHEAAQNGVDIELSVVAFTGLDFKQQVEQFITINREAKGVPTSLYLDLLGKLPSKKPQDIAKERAADIATILRRDENSPFYERIVVTTSPKSGQVSLTNFVRKVAPLLIEDRGILNLYTEKEQRAVVNNYFKALLIVYPEQFYAKDTIFFKTVGFGGLWNAFPEFFKLCITNYGGFAVDDAVKAFRRIENFDFSGWNEYGSGNKAEIIAGEDLKTALLIAYKGSDKDGGGLLRV